MAWPRGVSVQALEGADAPPEEDELKDSWLQILFFLQQLDSIEAKKMKDTS